MIDTLSARPGWQIWIGTALVSLGLAVTSTRSLELAVAAVLLLVIPLAVVLVWREPRWGVVALVFAVYADLLDAARRVTGVPINIRAAVVLLVGLLLLRRARGARLPTIPRRPLALACSVLVVVAASALVAGDPVASTTRLQTLAVAAAIALLLATFLSAPPWTGRAAWSVAGAGAMLAALSVFQQATHSYGSSFGGLARIKLDGTVARSGGPYEPNFFAQALVFSAALGLYLALRARGTGERAVAAALTLLCVGGIGLTSSRGGAIALLVVVAVVLGLRRPSRKVLVTVATASIALAVFALPPSTTERLQTVTEVTSARDLQFVDTSVRGRIAENLAAMRMFRENPLLGVGAGNFPGRYAEYAAFIGLDWRPVREPHNLYLEALAETGVVGGCVFLVFVLFTAGGAWRASRDDDRREGLLAEGVLAGLIGVLTTGVFLHGAYPQIAWTAYGLAWAAWWSSERRRPVGGRPGVTA